MVAPKTTTWVPEPHTRVKHAMHRDYLTAWFAILGSRFTHLVYIDGFAGAGRYEDGSDGSPILALKAALNQRKPLTSTIDFIFVEERSDRLAQLRREVSQLGLPPHMRCSYHQGKFDTTMSALLGSVVGTGQVTVPTFDFIDPFGYSQTPFSIVKRLLANRSSEAFIYVNFEELNRFLSVPNQSLHLDSLFGCDDWRQIIPIKDPEKRRERVRDLYQRQLEREARVKFVRPFEMRNGRARTDYFLFFATNNSTGLLKMKGAMWKADPDGNFLFSDAEAGQPWLFRVGPDYYRLRTELERQFCGKAVSIEAINAWVTEQTDFLPRHGRHALAEKESASPPTLRVMATSGRRRGQYPSGTTVLVEPSPGTNYQSA